MIQLYRNAFSERSEMTLYMQVSESVSKHFYQGIAFSKKLWYTYKVASDCDMGH